MAPAFMYAIEKRRTKKKKKKKKLGIQPLTELRERRKSRGLLAANHFDRRGAEKRKKIFPDINQWRV